MPNPDFEKRQDFLWIVQTTYIGNGINRASQEEYASARRHEYSGLGIKNEMCDAVRASYLIPDDMNAVVAADCYVTWKLLARPEDEEPAEQPSWVSPGFSGWDRNLKAKEKRS